MADEGNEDSWLYGGSHQDGIAGGDSIPATETDGAGSEKNPLWDEEHEESSSAAMHDAGDFGKKRRASNEPKNTDETSGEVSSATAGNGLSSHDQQCDDNAMDASDLQESGGVGDEPDESQDDSQLMDDDPIESGKRKQSDASAKEGSGRSEGKDEGDDGEYKEKRKQSSGEEKVGDDNGKDKGGLSDMESDIDSDEDDDINVVIGDIKSGPSYNIIKQRGPILPNQTASNAAGVTDKTKQPAGKFSMEEFESVGTINGVPAHEFSIDSLDEKPWRKPGADITDYFNYGFNEETWRSYCERQKRMRQHESGVGMAGLTINNPQAAPPIGMNMGMRDMRRSGGPMGGGPMGGPRKMNGPIEVIGGGPGGPMGGGPMGGGGGGRRDDGMGMSSQPKENVIQVMTADRREYSRTVVGNKYEPSMGGPPGFGGGPPDFYLPEVEYSDYYDPMQETQWGNDNGNWQPSGIKTLTPGPPMMGHPGMGGMPPQQQQQHMDMMGGGGGERMVMPPPQQMQPGMGPGGPGMGPGGGRIHPPGMPPGARGDIRNPNDRKRGDPRDQRDRDREREQRDRRDRERDRERERERDRDRERERERKERERGEHRSDREGSVVVPKEEVPGDGAVALGAAGTIIPVGTPSLPATSGSRDDKDKRSTKPDRHKDRHRERSRSRERSKSRRSDRSREREQRHSRDKKKSHRKDKEDGE
ncbi:pre-mRNA 3'-end-processing factor FIP1 [Anopheles ziemanni]|uniref:pre-mRNA 3'-end-processing factor FIP1 n=1 Tax=Anopheles coustani TaxID=139045 RepID=UPI002657E8E5|nr:pre-mRNA 3'-end-processing factor FIP1 [Anopheles coustani]XP_058170915.1 pre-mRNA 3'-end-processing factor FIP1 [Anopheles ziemanni]